MVAASPAHRSDARRGHRDHSRHGDAGGNGVFPPPHGQVAAPRRADRRHAAAHLGRHRRGPQSPRRDPARRLARGRRSRRADCPQQRDSKRARCQQVECIPREHLRQPRLRPAGLRRCGRARAFLSQRHARAHHRDAVRRARQEGPAARRYRLRLCRRRRAAGRRARRAPPGRHGARRIRRRLVSRRFPGRREARGAGRHPGRSRHPLLERPRRDHAEEGRRRLHRQRRPDAAEGAHPAHARAHRDARALGDPGDVLRRSVSSPRRRGPVVFENMAPPTRGRQPEEHDQRKERRKSSTSRA